MRQSNHADPGYAIDFEYFRPFFKRESIVLDFGCGNGGILSHVAKVVAGVDGVEVNPKARSIAEKTGMQIYPNIESIPNVTKYDIVFSNHVFEHVRDVCATLEQIRSHLNPNGLLLLKLPFDDANARYQQNWKDIDVDHHLFTWSPRLLANLLRETGYSVLDCRLITSAWHPKLFPFSKLGLDKLAFWTLAVVKRRRQVFAVAVNR